MAQKKSGARRTSSAARKKPAARTTSGARKKPAARAKPAARTTSGARKKPAARTAPSARAKAAEEPRLGEGGASAAWGSIFGEEPARGAQPSSFTPGFAPECMTCPFGLFFFAVRQVRPEAMEHLMRAGFELFQAFKSFMDQASERWEKAGSLQRIPIS